MRGRTQIQIAWICEERTNGMHLTNMPVTGTFLASIVPGLWDSYRLGTFGPQGHRARQGR